MVKVLVATSSQGVGDGYDAVAIPKGNDAFELIFADAQMAEEAVDGVCGWDFPNQIDSHKTGTVQALSTNRESLARKISAIFGDAEIVDE